MTQDKVGVWKIIEIITIIFTIVATGFGVVGAIKSDIEVLKSEIVNVKSEQKDLRTVLYDTKGKVDVLQGQHQKELKFEGIK